MAYDPHGHLGTTPRRRRSRHPCASSPHDRRRRTMPSSAIPLEEFLSSHSDLARGSILVTRFELYRPARVLASPLYLHLPSLWIFYYFYDHFRLLGHGPQVGPFPSRTILGLIRGKWTPPPPPKKTLAII